MTKQAKGSLLQFPNLEELFNIVKWLGHMDPLSPLKLIQSFILKH